MLPPMKKSISCCRSHQNPPTWTVFNCLELFCFHFHLICAYFSPDSHDDSLTKKAILQIFTLQDFNRKHWFGVKNVLNLLQLFISQDRSCMDQLWIIVMFLSAVLTLNLTAPIHCRGSIHWWTSGVMLSFNKFVLKKKQIHLHLEWPVGK